MLSPAECRSRLSRIVDASTEAADCLQRNLRDERRALELQDSDALGAAADGKRVCVSRLEALEKERQSVFTARHKGPGPEHMPALLAECGADDRIADGWRRFLKLAARCRALNTTNGAIIHRRRQQYAAALRIVSGSRTQSMDTYGPTGGAMPPRSSRALAEI